jgi:hypothetical protein
LAAAAQQRRAHQAAQRREAEALRRLAALDESRRVASASYHPTHLGYPTFQRFEPYFTTQRSNRGGNEGGGEAEGEAAKDQERKQENETGSDSDDDQSGSLSRRRRRPRAAHAPAAAAKAKAASAPPLRVAVLRLVSFSVRERGGVAEPSADLRLDVRHFPHPSLALQHPSGRGPGQGKASALQAIADAQQQADADAQRAQVDADAQATAQAAAGAVSSAAAAAVADDAVLADAGANAETTARASKKRGRSGGRRSKKGSRGRIRGRLEEGDVSSINWGSDEEPFPEAAPAAEADAPGMPVVPLPLAQAAPSVLPWWVALTGLDAGVQAAVAAEQTKLGEVRPWRTSGKMIRQFTKEQCDQSLGQLITKAHGLSKRA